jgi:hypothetical protein
MIHFVSTSPRVGTCPRCRRTVLTGVGEGIPFTLDPVPLTARAELFALVADRPCFALVAGRCAWRMPEHIRGDTKYGKRSVVFATHSCQHPATADDVDPEHVATVQRFLAQPEPRPDTPRWADAEIDTLDLIRRQLGARVIGADIPPY